MPLGAYDSRMPHAPTRRRLAPSLHHLPAYAWNGLTVALGVGMVQLVFGVFAGAQVAQLAASGAVCTSLADVPNTPGRTWQRVLAAAAWSVVAALVVALLRPHHVALGFGVAAVAFGAMMMMSWGARAGAVSFAPLLSMIFAMAVPEGAHAGVKLVLWNALGALAYVGWSMLSISVLQPRYRGLALIAALESTAQLFRSRAAVLQAPHAPEAAVRSMRAWIVDEAALAERLQSARDLLFAARDTLAYRRDAAMLLHAIDLRDVLLASRLDLDLLGEDKTGRLVVERVVRALHQIADAIDEAADAVHTGAPPAAREPLRFLDLFADVSLDPADRRNRLLPAVASRLQNLADVLARLQALLHGAREPLPLTRDQLKLFVAPEGWPLAALRAQLHIASPVLRHAVRMALALGSAYFIALVLPWASHPHWLVLSVAVVLRGNLEQTLTRRNARVFGTVLGCLLVVLLGKFSALHQLVFLVSVGVAHGYVNVRYIVTATAATVMALLQAHLVDPASGFAIAERLADTLLGAALAWAFSYVLPSWERRSLPQTIARSMQALQAYARLALQLDAGPGVQQRLARRQAYDALSAVAAAVQRSAVEPERVRIPLRPLSAFLDHGQRLMAHLSVIRLMLMRRMADLDAAETASLLDDSRAALMRELDVAASHASPDAETAVMQGLESLPEQPPMSELMPWLRRRLQATVRDAEQARASARLSLEALQEPEAGAARAARPAG
jgi:uncharacterized membrane protein YccC